MRRFAILLTVIFSLNSIIVSPAHAALQSDVTHDQVSFDFPNTATFSAVFTSNVPITSIVLEYGTQQLTCGQVAAKAFPQFTPDKTVQAEWTWEMKQSGSLPPGAQIWWRWHYTDETGKETLTDQKTVTWLDSVHKWQTISNDFLRLHWYGKDQAFAQGLLEAGIAGLERNGKEAGLKTEAPIDLYIYPNYSDMRDAVLYEPSWTGGQAFPEHNIVIMGISESDSAWDRSTVVHELTHVLVGHLTFSCLGDVPTWLNEGLAVYSEGQLDPSSQTQLEDAIQNNTLLSVRSLSAGFSEVSDKASLSYSQSYSIVKFLIEAYGREKVTTLLTTLRDGTVIDDALRKVYGFDVEGLEDEWRKAIQARPRTVSSQPTAQATPTFVPTIVPISGALLAVTSTPFVIPTSSTGNTPPPITRPSGPPIALTMLLLSVCCIMLLLFGVIGLGIYLRTQKHKGGNDEPRS